MSTTLGPLLLSRIQFAFTISYHIIFPSFTIGLAAWLAVLETLHILKKDEVYRRLFDFWLKIFAVAFGLGVVSGIVMALEFGTNWSRLSAASGPIQGPLLAYESFTAFALEASFFGVLLFGRPRLPPLLYLASVVMVALGTTLSAFWIMVNNSWMRTPKRRSRSPRSPSGFGSVQRSRTEDDLAAPPAPCRAQTRPRPLRTYNT